METVVVVRSSLVSVTLVRVPIHLLFTVRCPALGRTPTMLSPSMTMKRANLPACAPRRSVRAFAAAADVDLELSGLKHLPEAAREKALDKSANKFEKVKVEKCGSNMWTEVHELSALLKEGKYTFEELNLDDVDIRLKWAGLFHRAKRAKGTFMMRLKVRSRPLVEE